MAEIKKFLSRKFLLTLLSSLFAACVALSGVSGEIGSICSLIAAFATPVCYVVTEGKIDAASLRMTSDSLKKASEILDEKSAEE